MSDPILISPLLDGFLMGEPLSEHNGIRCCPAMENESEEKYIVKIISLPPSPTQLDAMLLAGVFADQQTAVKYYDDRADDYIREIEILQALSRQEGFLACKGYQSVPSQEHIGYDVYILTKYMRSLERQFTKKPTTHLEALNMSLDICSALTACRRNGYIFANLKPTNIFVTEKGEYKISDLGFISLCGLKYAALPENCISEYTPPEIEDASSSVTDTLDVYALGMILYRIFNGGTLPENKKTALEPPAYADEELSAIILKACSPNPDDRWRDPVQMGQMLVSYIQKNGTFDTPVVPPAPEPEIIFEPEVEPEVPEQMEEAIPEEIESSASDEEAISQEVVVTEESADNEAEIPETEVLSSPEETEDYPVCESQGDSSEDAPPDSQPEPEQIDSIAEEEPATDASDFADEDMQLSENTNSDTEQMDSEDKHPILAIEIADEEQTQNSAECQNSRDEITPEMTEAQLMQIIEQHDAFSDEEAEIRAAAVYLELDRVPEEVEDSSYDGVSAEVSKILSQADTLVTMHAPTPAVAPEAPEIVLELPLEKSPEEDTSPNTSEEEIEITEDETDMKSNEIPTEKPRRSHLVRNIVIIAILLLLLAGGALFYQFIVIQTVDKLEVTGVKDQLIIEVSSEADDSLLSISCIDEQGNYTTSDGHLANSQTGVIPVYDGKAEITGLRANTNYTIKLHIAGLHILEGKTEKTYKTPDETTLLQHNVITGNEPGSAILNFTVDGPDSEKWNFTYSAAGYEEKTISFSGTSVTITDLIPNKVYNGVLTPEDDLFITQPFEIEFTASELIQAQDLKIIECSGGKLTVQWNAPENTVVESWIVHCYSNKEGSDYDKTVTISTTSYEFKGLESSESFTVEVKALGQEIFQEVTIPANSVTVTNLNADTSIAGSVNLTWESISAPDNGWTVSYQISGTETVTTLKATEKNIIIKPVVPNTEYVFTVASADAVHTFCQEISAVTMATDDFRIDINDNTITAEDLKASLFKQPSDAQWDHSTLKNNDYTTKFSVGEKVGLLVYLKKQYEESLAELDATFVIYNDKGEIIIVSSQEGVWNKAWTQNNCIYKIPTIPQEAGYYKIAFYLNSQLVSEHDFSIS